MKPVAEYVLRLGDCLEVMKHISSGSVDLILCDLPYGTTACKWDTIIPFEKLWVEYKRIAKPNAAFVLFASQPFTSVLGASFPEALKYSWVWEKSRPTGHLNAKHQPLTGFEDILVFYREKATYNPQNLVRVNKTLKNSSSHLKRNKDNVTSTVSGGLKDQPYTQEFSGYPRGILNFASDGNRVHPTQKPVPLLEYLIKTYTNEGDVVMDNTMGSGSTGVACLNTDRRFIGIEKEQAYFEIAKERMENTAKQLAIVEKALAPQSTEGE